MAKRRCECSAGEIGTLVDDLATRVEGMAMTSQPEVAAKVVELVAGGEAGLGEFARVIEKDSALAGRLLKLSNSAYFGQRQPVTRIDRACVLLGLERIRAISLGFYLSRSADESSTLSRRIWGESIYRACLAGELAQVVDQVGTAEAFLVGLLLDCGLPMMPRVLEPYLAAAHQRSIGHDRSSWKHEPEEVFKYEWNEMPFTHADVAAAMTRVWNLPEVLAKPVIRHHVGPPRGRGRDQTEALHRIAYYMGRIVLDPDQVEPEGSPEARVAELLGVDVARLRDCYGRAGEEYKAVVSLFSDVADSVNNLDRLQEAVSVQMLGVIERSLEQESFTLETREPVQFEIAGVLVEIERSGGCEVTAYRRDAQGNRLVSFSFDPCTRAELDVLSELGIEIDVDDIPPLFIETLRTLAA